MTIRVRVLSAEERAELTRMARSRTLCAGRVKRAQLVLLAVEGRKAAEIAEELRLHARTARFWLKRFNAQGLAGLEESERPGRPPVYPADQIAAVIATALARAAGPGAGAACRPRRWRGLPAPALAPPARLGAGAGRPPRGRPRPPGLA